MPQGISTAAADPVPGTLGFSNLLAPGAKSKKNKKNNAAAKLMENESATANDTEAVSETISNQISESLRFKVCSSGMLRLYRVPLRLGNRMTFPNQLMRIH